jgi:hypothetical protein
VHNAVAAGSREQADAAMTQVNDVLAMVEQSTDLSPSYRASIVNAVRGVLAGMEGGAADEPAVSSVDGHERVVVDPAPATEALATLADGPATPAPIVAARAPLDARLAAILRTAGLAEEFGALRLIAVAPMRAAVPAHRRVDILV